MNYPLAARELLQQLGKEVKLSYARQNEHEPCEIPHLHWMLLQLQSTEMSDGKAGRWLGWVQACLVMKKLFDLSEMKALNQACSCDDEGCPEFNTTHVHG